MIFSINNDNIYNKQTLEEILNKTDYKHIYLSSDWHLFQTRHKPERTYVNTQEIISWCKNNIHENDVFMFLGDITYRWASDEENKQAQEILKSIPGIKILIIGNHDAMIGEEFYSNCGFNYVFEEFLWKKYLFTHRPKNIEDDRNIELNIHGHMHKWREYNTTDGSKNINVYPWYYDNKPVTFEYILNHKDELIEGNKKSNWDGIMGESAEILQECSDIIDEILNASTERKMDEWCMAACNPILPTVKPFIVKAISDDKSIINSKQYALAPDIVSDKYLVIDENNKLSIVDYTYFNNYYIEIYEYIGNTLNLAKIKKDYDNGTIVNTNYIYETLSSKQLLSDDQIDFDDNFVKIEPSLYTEKIKSKLATIKEQWMELNDKSINIPYIESVVNESNYNFGDLLILMEDVNGYYLKNKITHERTRSVESINKITDAMVKSI